MGLSPRQNQDLDKMLRVKALAHRDLDPRILDQWHDDPDRNIRLAVAEHPNTAPNTLGKMAYDKKIRIRLAVAENPHTPARALLYLSRDQSYPDIARGAQNTTKEREEPEGPEPEPQL